MSEPRFQFGWLNDSRLAAQALSPTPVWLWSAATNRILWANPVAAAIFDAPSPQAAAAIDFGAGHAAALQIARLASTLPQGGAPRLERLRGFGAALGGTLICLCSKITLADNSAAVLVAATERAGKELALPERARRLLIDIEAPAAIFTADGELIEAQAAARARFGSTRGLKAYDRASLDADAQQQATRALEALRGDAFSHAAYRSANASDAGSRQASDRVRKMSTALSRTAATRADTFQAIADLAEKLAPGTGERGTTLSAIAYPRAAPRPN